MNEFTKEELTIMVDGIVLIKKQCVVNYDTQLKLDELDEKLCSMINNYCEHESDGLIYHQWFGEEKHNCRSCIKCGEFYR